MARVIVTIVRKAGLYEAAAAAVRLVERLRRPGKVRRYFRDHAVRKLQIGTGGNVMEGWLNTDWFIHDSRLGDARATFLDARKRFPFDDNCFDYIFSEHMIEHMRHAEGLHMLRECGRVLKPGGRLRIATPDLDFITALREGELTGARERYVRSVTEQWMPEVAALGWYDAAFVINNALRNWGHLFVYDARVLRKTLELAGFEAIERVAVGRSAHPALDGVEYHGRLTGEEVNALETMVFEAGKPVAAL